MLGGEGASRSTGLETWVVVGGGSNSYGMGGAVMKAVHNTGLDDGKGSGISKQESAGMNIWQTNCIVDTIRFADGTTKIRKLAEGCPGVGAINGASGISDAIAVKLLDYFKDWDVEFKPGAIRVTHMALFYFNAVQHFLDKVAASYLTAGPWKRMMLWAHSTQRSTTEKVKADLTELVKSPVCARAGVLCVVGTKYPRDVGMITEQQKLTFPNSPVHLLDTSAMVKNNFEFYGAHGLQSLHLEMFQMLL